MSEVNNFTGIDKILNFFASTRSPTIIMPPAILQRSGFNNAGSNLLMNLFANTHGMLDDDMENELGMALTRNLSTRRTLEGGQPGGTAGIGRAVNIDHDTEVSRLFVSDAGILPISPGMPPVLTIIALSKRF